MSGATGTAVTVEDLVVRRNGRFLVGPLSLELPAGATLGVRGPSGAGKSTLLRALVGLLPPGVTVAGRVRVLGTDVGSAGVDLPGLRARAGLVGQTPVVFPASILANAAFGLRHAVRTSRRQLLARARSALEEAGLWDEVAERLDEPAEELSVGQRQRLCLARALALDPELLLLDEPTSALDRTAAARVEEAVVGLEARRSVLVVSHDQAQLDRLCHTVVTLPDRPGPVGAPAPGAARAQPGRGWPRPSDS